MNEQSITPALCKAARALVGFNQGALAKRAKIAKQTLADFERGARMPHPENLAKIRAALEKAGVVFIDSNGGGPGVRLKRKAKR